MRVTQASIGPNTQVALGVIGIGAPGLITGCIITQSGGMTPLVRLVAQRLRPYVHTLSFRDLQRAARRYRDFPLYSTWGGLLDTAGGTLTLYLLIGAFYSKDIVGFLFVSQRFVGRPLAMMATAV